MKKINQKNQNRKQIGDSLELRVKGIFNNAGMKVKISKNKKNGQIDLQGFNYKTGKEVFVECKSRRVGKIDNAAVAVFVNKLIKRNVIMDNKIREDCEAYIVTNSYFTKDAENDAQYYRIALIDKIKLNQMEALSQLDTRYSAIKQINNISNYLKEQGVRGAVGSWLRRRVFDPISY